MPSDQTNERSALTLLALLHLKPTRRGSDWSTAMAALLGITEIMDYMAEHFGKQYAPNTRETVRRFTIHQFVQAGFILKNPDDPKRPTNSPDNRYQVELGALALFRTFGTPAWPQRLREYLTMLPTLKQRYASEREMQCVPLELSSGKTIRLSPGGQNDLIKHIIDDFCPRFTPGATPIYIGDTAKKWACFDKQGLADLGVRVEKHGQMPDVVVHLEVKNWLVLMEAVTSHGPMTPKRLVELKKLFAGATCGLVFVSAFPDRKTLNRYLAEIAWETEVWVAESPTHLIHFNGERFLGPYVTPDGS
ncbi:MAG: restriction endonuclease [Planctomycetes bacterium]|nr:restriction endonuclease [Planctomycetota bacterium]